MMIQPGPVDIVGLTAEIAASLRRFDHRAADDVCARITAGLRRGRLAPTEAEAVAVLRLLQRKRCFPLVQRTADAMIHNGLDRPAVRLHYVQALVDQELPGAALGLLRGVLEGPVSDAERTEAHGLAGRAYKQLYIAGDDGPHHRQEYLDRAVAGYHEIYRADETSLWHGINTVALLRRGLRDGLEPAGFDDPARYAHDLANRILTRIAAEPEPDAWTLATAVEACVALDRTRDAQEWLARYVEAPEADAFELASTLRQLVEVWQLDDGSGAGERLFPMLRAALLRREGGVVTVPAAHLQNTDLDDLADEGLESIFGTAGFHTLRWFRDALERCRRVARIEDDCGDGVGTGILVDGRALHESMPAVVLLTNAHVVPNAITPDAARLTFRGREAAGGDAEKHRVDAIVWSSPREALDVSVLSLRTVPSEATECPIESRLLPLERQPRVLIIGHPHGRMQPMFSIQHNLVLDYNDTRVHYAAATEPGSSGSPAFDNDWRLIGLHHSGSDAMPRLRGSGTYQANEGIRISSIRDAIQRDRDGRVST
ncbi:serine protease [Virgisporangium aurantiacum]|uniref:Serine protease n=1 Tax=Virgisporangium aurantiacum TaxID=175570 RepID=A0A8J3ZH00_9ACTN|nr:serine protease [Virgisporangium aurantiacum]GIJ63646.1 hypothetical protein Vau01_111620 [Virgisporangium aurantiacum]